MDLISRTTVERFSQEESTGDSNSTDAFKCIDPLDCEPNPMAANDEANQENDFQEIITRTLCGTMVSGEGVFEDG